MFGDVLVDGVAVPFDSAAVSVMDAGLQRGYGCFETIRAYGGVPFRLEGHLRRLETSASLLALELPDPSSLAAWVTDRAGAGGDCVVRILVTGGGSEGRPSTRGHTVVMAESLGRVPVPFRVRPVVAPWHPDGMASELTGAKTLSYAPNLAATMAAQRAGFDDALLLGRSGAVLEGPTYSVGWIRDGVLATPGLELGVLASITRGVVLELAAQLGIAVEEGRFSLDEMTSAAEPFAMSTNKEVLPIAAIGDRSCSSGPTVPKLAAAFDDLVRRETT